jgi:hypothetical protein
MGSISQTVAGGVRLLAPLALLTQCFADPPLPPLATVLNAVVRQSEKESENERAFNQRYDYTRTKVTEYRNGKGELKKREERIIANHPSAVPVAFRTPPTASRTGPNLGGEKSEAVSDTRSNVRGKAFEKKDFSLNDDLLGRFEFDLVGRNTINGRPTLVLEFKPAKKNLPERSIKDRFINKAAGRIWVDEADSIIAKADVHLTESVYVVGGLVGAVWKFHYSFDRERTSDGLWFTRTVDWHLEGREVVLRRAIDYHEGKSDVRKVDLRYRSSP